VEIAGIYLTDTVPVPFEKPWRSYVDKFGQWNQKGLARQGHTEEELAERMKSLEAGVQNSQFPEGGAGYGGWKAGNSIPTDSSGYTMMASAGGWWILKGMLF